MRIVLDANVYIGAEVSPKGVCAKVIKCFTWPFSPFQLITTKKILAEVLDVLTRPRIIKVTQKDADEVRLAIENYAEWVTIVPDRRISAKACRDPKDVIYLSAARTSKASLIVSWDQDLLELIEYQGIKIIKPDEFLRIAPKIS